MQVLFHFLLKQSSFWVLDSHWHLSVYRLHPVTNYTIHLTQPEQVLCIRIKEISTLSLTGSEWVLLFRYDKLRHNIWFLLILYMCHFWAHHLCKPELLCQEQQKATNFNFGMLFCFGFFFLWFKKIHEYFFSFYVWLIFFF